MLQLIRWILPTDPPLMSFLKVSAITGAGTLLCIILTGMGATAAETALKTIHDAGHQARLFGARRNQRRDRSALPEGGHRDQRPPRKCSRSIRSAPARGCDFPATSPNKMRVSDSKPPSPADDGLELSLPEHQRHGEAADRSIVRLSARPSAGALPINPTSISIIVPTPTKPSRSPINWKPTVILQGLVMRRILTASRWSVVSGPITSTRDTPIVVLSTNEDPHKSRAMRVFGGRE